ncbi:hypothetical protein HOF56_04425 [Candidatus Peribacteria bacterium]|jgi:hypothetical protein|nr:hypothetical protein [Candidatus Peribacteria bacterium]MBT4020821.1 hypothetical protein [Candidatus Peribacteria bacterium]MBT4240354.1 hypothetical protein [Candidatus Peribacteria bacterium]MBT4474646.1 hypothetical protein [Candidatus Peribacteria bacterium]
MNIRLLFFALFFFSITIATPVSANRSDRLLRIKQRMEIRLAQRENKKEVRNRNVRKKRRITSRAIRMSGETIKFGARRRSADRYSPKKITPKSLEGTDFMPNQKFEPTLPLPNIDALSKFLLLGTNNSVIATVGLSSGDEPIHIRRFTITLDSEASSLSSMEVIDEFGYILGSATLDIAESSNKNVFTLDISSQKAYFIDKDDKVSIAIRTRMKQNESGGISGEELQVTDISVNAIGLWSNKTASIDKSGPDFLAHETSLARIKSITNSGNASGVFGIGTNRPIASFNFESQSINSRSANPAITSLVFSVNSPSAVELANIKLRTYGLNNSTSCSFIRPRIICDSIDESIGAIDSVQKLILSADVSLSGSHPNVYLQISINDPGSPNSSGDITWTDGVGVFNWIDLDSPVVNGTDWR